MKAIILLLAAHSLFWPWHHRGHRHHRAQPPNCEEINAVVKSLPPERYEKALRSATKAQQKIITDCEAQP